jgi:uncharacterized protein
MTDRLYLREMDKQTLLQLLTRYLPTASAWVYGSRITGQAHAASDLDIVLRSADLSPIPILEMEDFLDALRESNIPILVEARDWTRLPESFHEEILNDYVVLKEGNSEGKAA